MVITFSNPSVWEEFFGVSKNTAFQTIIPTVISVLIFMLGLFFGWLKNILTNRKKSSQIRKFVISQIKVLIQVTEEQKKNIQKLLTDLQIEQLINLSYELKIGFNTQHIRNIPSSDLFRVFVLEYYRNKAVRLKVFNILLEQLDLIDGLRSEFISSFEYVRIRSSKYEKEWNDNIEIVGDTHDRWAAELGKQIIKDDPFLNMFFILYHQWAMSDKYTDMYVAETKLIDTTLKIAKESQPNTYGFELIRPLLKGKAAVTNHRNLRNAMIEEYNLYLTQMNGITEKLNSFMKLYEKI